MVAVWQKAICNMQQGGPAHFVAFYFLLFTYCFRPLGSKLATVLQIAQEERL